MAEKCENKGCITGRAADLILHIPTKTVGGVNIESTPIKVCAACAKKMVKDDRSILRPIRESRNPKKPPKENLA